MPPKNVLYTAFTAMDSWPSNTSEILMQSFQEVPPGLSDALAEDLTINYVLFDAIADSLEQQVAMAVGEYDPDIILFTGSARKATLRLERFALNWLQIDQADAAGATYAGQKLFTAAPDALCSRLGEIDSLAASLQAEGIPCVVSNFAGTSLCNQVLYYGLHQTNDDVLCGFLHVPLLPEQVQGIWSDMPSMELEDQRRGIARVIEGLLRESERRG